MKKIILLENTGMMRIHIEGIIRQLEDVIIDTLDNDSLERLQNKQRMKGASIFIIDLDNMVMDVAEFIKDVRKEEGLGKLPFLFITSSADIRMVVSISKLGNTDVLRKPFSDAELLTKVMKLFPKPTISDLNVPMKPESGFMLSWSDEYRIGVDIIDQEHKAIFDQFEKLYMSMKEGRGLDFYDEILSFVDDYVKTHFQHEELYQEEIGYNLRSEHKTLHGSFRTEIQNIILEHKKSNGSYGELIRFMVYLKKWILYHILVEDKKIGIFVSERTNK